MSPARPGPGPDPDAAVFVISVAAELTGLHPQTLRAYDRMGLVQPGRTGGGGRRYSHHDLDRLRTVAELTAAGIGIEGVRRLLDLEHQVSALQARNEDLLAELEETREALRRALTPADPVRRPAGDRDRATNKLPVLRTAGPGQAVVVWRRPR